MENDKKTNRQLIELIQNDLKHIQDRLGRVEREQWALMAGVVILIISKFVFG